jgi:hypothetical protein
LAELAEKLSILVVTSSTGKRFSLPNILSRWA